MTSPGDMIWRFPVAVSEGGSFYRLFKEKNLPTGVYHALVDGVNKSLPSFHRYLRLRARMLGGSVTRGFDTHAEAVAFWAKHGDSLPNSGDLVVSVGGVAQATWAGAVLESVTAPPPVGVSVTVTYAFRLAGPAT